MKDVCVRRGSKKSQRQFYSVEVVSKIQGLNPREECRYIHLQDSSPAEEGRNQLENWVNVVDYCAGWKFVLECRHFKVGDLYLEGSTSTEPASSSSEGCRAAQDRGLATEVRRLEVIPWTVTKTGYSEGGVTGCWRALTGTTLDRTT